MMMIMMMIQYICQNSCFAAFPGKICFTALVVRCCSRMCHFCFLSRCETQRNSEWLETVKSCTCLRFCIIQVTTIRCLHILKKHTKSRRPSSWRERVPSSVCWTENCRRHPMVTGRYKPKVSDSMSVWIAWEIIEKHRRFKGGYW